MGSDYLRTDENECIPRRIKIYGSPDIIIEVATAHGLRCECVSFPSWDFCVLKIFATRRQFKAAQFSWLQRMIDDKPQTEIEL